MPAPRALEQAAAVFDKHGKDDALSVAVEGAEILAPMPEPRQMRDGMSFPLHILQAPRGQLKLAARAKNDMAELARLDAEPLGELPEVYRKQPIYYITNRFSVRGTNTTVKWPRYSQVMDYELRIRHHHQEQGRQYFGGQGQGSHLRLYDLQRFLGARCPADRDGGPARPRQGQEF